MVKDFQISDEAASLVVDLHLSTTEAMQRTTPQKQPILLLVGGQPGAGKSGTSKDAKSYLRAQGGYVHLDADRLREGIPEYPRFVREFGEQASVITQAASGKCVAKLRALALEGKRNILEEGTLRGGGEVFVRYANRMQEQGYKVELRILAVAPEESRLGVYKRYEDQLSAGNRGARFVPDSYHDQTCNAMIGTVQALESVADRVVVVTRDGDVLYDSRHQGIGEYKNAIGAIGAGRVMTSTQKAMNAMGWDVISLRAEQRQADPSYLEQISRHRAAAHSFMRQDPQSARFYDEKLPGAGELSRAVAVAHESGFRQRLHENLSKLKVQGMTDTQLRQTAKDVLVKLADSQERKPSKTPGKGR